MRFAPVAPHALAMAVLKERFGREHATLGECADLAQFQREAVQRLELSLARHGGAILADSVGLGKTRVGALVARRAAAGGARVLVIAPPVLCGQWRRALRVGTIPVVSMAALARARKRDGPGLLVVDEAHAFRNPRTRRYRALAELARDARVLLITATPVNNSLRDLYWLLRLFAGDAAFADAGIADLRACFDAAERSGGAGRIPAVLGRVMVRRTRSLLLEEYGVGSGRGAGGVAMGHPSLRFPRRAPPVPVRYAPAGSWRTLLQIIEELELRAWLEPRRGTDLLLRMLLLRRAESSRAAGLASLTALDRALGGIEAALAAGLDPHSSGTPAWACAGDQLSLPALLLAPLPRGVDAVALAHSAARDRQRIAAARDLLGAGADAKVAALEQLLQTMQGRPVVLFTEFRDTAIHLHHALHRRHRTGLVHGTGALLGDAPAGRRTVIERFAPLANGSRAPPARERVSVLISTDVLAEGLDLHDAADVVSYDLPWNPVRLIQRVGRIDRLGSRHEVVRSYHFVPDRDLERTLGVMRRLRRKLHAIDCTVGSEAEVLARSRPDVPRILRGDGAALARLERTDALACDLEERLRAAFARALRPPADSLPLFRDAATGTRGAMEEEPAGIPVARVAVDLALAGPLARARGPLCCVWLESPAGPRAMAVRGRTTTEDDLLAGAALLAALQSREPKAPSPRDLLVARRALARAAATTEPGARRPAPAARTPALLRKRLLLLLERAPGGASAEECARVELLLEALGRCPAGAEHELRRLAPELRQLPLSALCGRIEEVLGTARSRLPLAPLAATIASGPEGDAMATPAASGRGPPRVLAVLLVEGGSVDRARTGR